MSSDSFKGVMCHIKRKHTILFYGSIMYIIVVSIYQILTWSKQYIVWLKYSVEHIGIPDLHDNHISHIIIKLFNGFTDICYHIINVFIYLDKKFHNSILVLPRLNSTQIRYFTLSALYLSLLISTRIRNVILSILFLYW